MREIRRSTRPELRRSAVTMVTAFSGIGGVEVGALMSGRVRPIASIECDPTKPILSKKFEEVHKNNTKGLGHKFHLMTVQEAAAQEYRMIPRGLVHWYHGSPVCSNFSLVNTGSQGETETDVSNVNAYISGIDAIAPRVVTCEQVPAFKDSQGAMNLYEALDTLRYDFQWQVVNMADYGVPQDRLRYWLLAWKRGDRPWKFPAPCRRAGWFDLLYDLDFAPLPPSRLLDGQKISIEVHQYHYDCNTFLVERVATRDGFKIRSAHEVAPTIRRMIFTDKKPGDRDQLVSRKLFMDAMILGQIKTLGLPHIRRLCSFPDWFEAPDIPAVTGVGYGYACSPEFVRLLAETNLGT